MATPIKYTRRKRFYPKTRRKPETLPPCALRHWSATMPAAARRIQGTALDTGEGCPIDYPSRWFVVETLTRSRLEHLRILWAAWFRNFHPGKLDEHGNPPPLPPRIRWALAYHEHGVRGSWQLPQWMETPPLVGSRWSFQVPPVGPVSPVSFLIDTDPRTLETPHRQALSRWNALAATHGLPPRSSLPRGTVSTYVGSVRTQPPLSSMRPPPLLTAAPQGVTLPPLAT